MKILFCSSEVFPFAKTGGLADVSGALPEALEKLGCQVKVALPKYRGLQNKAGKLGQNIEVYFIENEKYFDRSGLYGTEQGDHPDNLERFTFFCQKTLELIKQADFKPDIIHCNDWQTALIPVYLKTVFANDHFFNGTKTIFTIHNLAYQGLFPRDKFDQTGLDKELFSIRGLEFFGKINLLKGGLVFSDFLTTVSPTYAEEIQTLKFGCGLDGVLRGRKKDLIGIINGLDTKVWDPQNDDKIFQRYGEQSYADKAINKLGLQDELGLVADQKLPLIGMVGRLAEQKGMELVISTIEQLLDLKLQVVILGTGEQRYHLSLGELSKKFSGRFSVNLRFDEMLAHKIYAGSDFFLMPSFYEPCGLGQLIAFKYGTIPIVHQTGGLADTVSDYDPGSGVSNGFVYHKNTGAQMLKAIARAQELYQRPQQQWPELIRRVMGYDFSWDSSAKKYINLYKNVLSGRQN
ncbi:glycogen synthase [Candidatus Omnitrophota bacterium]